MAEPGLAIERNGSPHIQEAAADSGEDLRPTWSSSAGSPGYGMNLGRRWAAEACELDYALSLSLPAARPGVIRRLRGYLPIMALARTGPLLDTPIAGCEGTSHVVGETTLTVRAVNRVGGRVHAMTIQIRNDPSVAPTSPTIAAGPRQATLAPVTPRFFAADHVQLIDEKGRPCSITINQPPARPDGSLDLTITVGRDPAAGDPARIRYFGIVAELTEVPFLFEAVPIP
jgi:hypothetical protein